MRRCPACKRTDVEFYDSTVKHCKPCWRACTQRYREANRETVRFTTRRSWHKNKDKYALARKYGGPTIYTKMFAEQGGVCAICKRPETSGRYKTLCVDHCHATGKIRGLLCGSCNRAIGLLGDEEWRLEAAAQYLRSFR